MRIKCPECQTTLSRQGGVYRCPSCDFQLELEPGILDDLRARLRELKASLGSFSVKDLKSILGDKEHPATSMLIDFIAWGMRYFVRFPVFLAVVLGLSFLLGPWGIVIMIVLPIVYRAHSQSIHAEVEKMMRQEKEDSSNSTRV